ncbi:type IV secretory system conjugative DNA transfer family protein [Nonomuraea insulae]|uniref:Type IV secretory system conjugative DNA transfer family protein n=1 Tax=Nonomuraea insulae TaxID=1616787 RepID=A0ABW1DAB8_9ACTN
MDIGTGLSIDYFSADSQTLNVQVAMTCKPEEVSEAQGDLVDLLSNRYSPVMISRSHVTARPIIENPRRQINKLRGVFWCLAPFRIDNVSKISNREVVVSYRDANLETFASAVLANPGIHHRILIGPVDLTTSEITKFISARRPAGAPNSRDITDFLAHEESLVDLQFIVRADLPTLSPRMKSGLREFGRGTEVRAVPAEMNQGFSRAWARYEFARTGLASVDPIRVSLPTARSLFRFPVARAASFPGFVVEPLQPVRMPAGAAVKLSDTSIRFGRAIGPTGDISNACLAIGDIARHVFVPGQTGSGKSTLLRALACGIADTGDGLLFIDPHGETVRHLLGEIPRKRREDVVFIDAADIEMPAAINPFSVSEALQRDTALENVTAMFHDLFDPHHQGIVGPRWETMFRMGMLTLLATFDTKASLLDVPALFVDDKFLRRCKRYVKDDVVLEYWDKQMAQTSDFHKSEVLGWFSSKFTAFRTNSVLKAVLGSGADALDAREAMDTGRIVLVSLSKGEIGSPICQLLGYVYLARYWSAALRRRSGRPFTLFVDEAQSFSMGSLPAILAEGRKFGLQVIMATQFFEQLSKELVSSVQGNVGNVLSLRVGVEDAERLVGRFGPEFDVPSLRRMQNFMAASSILVHGVVQPAFSIFIDHETHLNSRMRTRTTNANAIIRQSRQTLASSRTASITQAEKMRAAFRAMGDSGGRGITWDRVGAQDAAEEEDVATSFLEEWLARPPDQIVDSDQDELNGDNDA